MYPFLLFLYSVFRWLVLLNLITAIYTAYTGAQRKKPFSTWANLLRHWTATIAHLQLLIGVTLYFQSPVVKLTMPADGQHLINEHIFFRYVHISLMLLAVVLITIGSAKTKRMSTDQEKYRTMFRWFTAGLIVILIAVPWSFSPLASRPYIRSF